MHCTDKIKQLEHIVDCSKQNKEKLWIIQTKQVWYVYTHKKFI